MMVFQAKHVAKVKPWMLYLERFQIDKINQNKLYGINRNKKHIFDLFDNNWTMLSVIHNTIS